MHALWALVKHGVDVNAQPNRGETSLFLAAKITYNQRGAEVVALLLRSGANETILNEEGESAANVVAEDDEEEFRVGGACRARAPAVSERFGRQGMASPGLHTWCCAVLALMH